MHSHCLPPFFFSMYLIMNHESSWKQGVMAMPRIMPVKNLENRVRMYPNVARTHVHREGYLYGSEEACYYT